MVGHAHPVERLLDPDVVAQRMLDRGALGVLERGVRPCQVVAKEPSIHRPASVHVLLAEIRIAERIALG
jgi:hypothetical protein